MPKDSKTTNEWGDRRDQWSDKIDDAHPIKTGKYKTYDVALQMVNNRHSKYDLADLVNWLLNGGYQ